MHKLCKQCNVCAPFLPNEEPDQKELAWAFGRGVERPLVLVIDDACSVDQMLESTAIAERLIGKDILFTYTRTIRCSYSRASEEHITTAAASCAVWTGLLANERAVVLATQRGLKQLRMEGHEIGDAFRNSRLGLVLCIPPLFSLSEEGVRIYQSKVQRLLRKMEKMDA